VLDFKQIIFLKGDSGGPAVIENVEDGKTVQIGIISFSFGKCGHNLPLILIRMSQYLDWLQENAGVTIDD
jgi:secreted trypsin-like serine protease